VATFTCEKQVADVARACGFRVEYTGLSFDRAGRPFRVYLDKTGREARKLKDRLFTVAFRVFSVCECGCGKTCRYARRPEYAALIFDLVAPSIGRRSK